MPSPILCHLQPHAFSNHISPSRSFSTNRPYRPTFSLSLFNCLILCTSLSFSFSYKTVPGISFSFSTFLSLSLSFSFAFSLFLSTSVSFLNLNLKWGKIKMISGKYYYIPCVAYSHSLFHIQDDPYLIIFDNELMKIMFRNLSIVQNGIILV